MEKPVAVPAFPLRISTRKLTFASTWLSCAVILPRQWMAVLRSPTRTGWTPRLNTFATMDTIWTGPPDVTASLRRHCGVARRQFVLVREVLGFVMDHSFSFCYLSSGNLLWRPVYTVSSMNELKIKIFELWRRSKTLSSIYLALHRVLPVSWNVRNLKFMLRPACLKRHRWIGSFDIWHPSIFTAWFSWSRRRCHVDRTACNVKVWIAVWCVYTGTCT